MNPGQSVKDRAALYIIQDAMHRGELRPGGTVVEGTAGNTGIGLTVIGNALGFRTVIVIPETQSREKKDALRLLGAQLVEVPARPYKDPNSYVHYSERLARSLAKTEPNGAIWANQWDNTANRRAHIETTPRDLGRHRWQGRWLCIRRRIGWHLGRCFRWPQGQAPEHPDCARRRARRRAL
jgi:cysteine synthase A